MWLRTTRLGFESSWERFGYVDRRYGGGSATAGRASPMDGIHAAIYEPRPRTAAYPGETSSEKRRKFLYFTIKARLA